MMEWELKLFVKFRDLDVLDKVEEFIDEQWKHNIKLIRDFEVAYVDEYEDAQYGTVYAVTDDELNLIGVFAKHEPYTYREVVELIREDSGESGDIVLFDITGYTGLDYNMPKYFKGDKNETDAFLEEPIKDTDELVDGLNIENTKEVNTCIHNYRDKKDMVNKPSHYTFSDKFEIIDVVEEITSQYPPHLAFAIGNAVKYIARSQHKNGKQDIEKSIWYLQRVLEKYDEE